MRELQISNVDAWNDLEPEEIVRAFTVIIVRTRKCIDVNGMHFLINKKIFKKMIPIKLFVFLPKCNKEEEIRHNVLLLRFIFKSV